MSILQAKKDTNMTEGSILGHLIKFAVPLLFGQLFQQLYNTVDSIVVGQFVSTQALAAVGSTNYIINTLIGFFLGLSTGAGVVISQHYGARDDRNVHTAVHTTVVMTLVMGVIFTIVGVVIVPHMLRFMSTPEDVVPDATTYLRIYFAGSVPLLIYNMGSGVLRAVGDSRNPLIFLIVASLSNVILDLLFVLGFGMGVEGVAYATVLAQIISAVLVLRVLTTAEGAYRLSFRQLHCNFGMLRRIVIIGLPAAIQQAVTAFSNVFVQSYINKFNTACMAGWSCFNKIEQFILLPIHAMALSITTFVSQNLGINDVTRAKKGIRISLIMGFIITAALTLPIVLFAPWMVRLFNHDPEVIHYGSLFLQALCPFLLLGFANQVLGGALRGAGDSRAPMIISLSCFVLLRQVYLFIISRLTSTALPIAMGYPLGWLTASLLMVLYYRFSNWETKRMILTDAPAK